MERRIWYGSPKEECYRGFMKTVSNSMPKWFALLMLGLMFNASGAQKYREGDVVAAFSVKDQHGQPFTFAPGIRHLLLSFEMSTAKLANQKLSELGKDFLPQHNAVFLADIHAMPGIGRMFALPKMRRYNHRILLGDQKGLMDPFPFKEGLITVLTLDAEARVTAIEFWDAAKEPVEPLLVREK